MPTARRSRPSSSCACCPGCWSARRTSSRWMPRRPRCARPGSPCPARARRRRSTTGSGGRRRSRRRSPRASPAPHPSCMTEDVARGMRVEVWDDTVEMWRSLHARHTEATVVGLPARSIWATGTASSSRHRPSRARRPRRDPRAADQRARGHVRLGGLEPLGAEARQAAAGRRHRRRSRGPADRRRRRAHPHPVTVHEHRSFRTPCRGCATGGTTPSVHGSSTSRAMCGPRSRRGPRRRGRGRRRRIGPAVAGAPGWSCRRRAGRRRARCAGAPRPGPRSERPAGPRRPRPESPLPAARPRAGEVEKALGDAAGEGRRRARGRCRSLAAQARRLRASSAPPPPSWPSPPRCCPRSGRRCSAAPTRPSCGARSAPLSATRP